MSQSLQFSRFFSSATSTDMTMTDLQCGNAASKDHFPTYSLSRGASPNPAHILDFGTECMARGCKWMYFGSSPYSRRKDESNWIGVQVNDPDLPNLCEKTLRNMAQAKSEGRQFAAYFWDDSSHLAYPSQQKDRMDGASGRLRMAYALIDASLNRLLSGMAELGLWDDTIIIGFGDHGDEAWSHGLHRGYCHSLPPYASLTWTPMFIFDPSRFKPAITTQLASTVDLKATAMGMLFPGRPSSVAAPQFSGINLLEENRDLAFSQNMFALQRELSDPEKGMIKGYSVTDGNYRLVAVSGADNPKKGGMALYCDQADPSNSLNLLKFFRLDKNGDIRKFSPPPDAVTRHFIDAFGPPQVESLQAAFASLKPALVNFVRKKEAAALEEYNRILHTPAAELGSQFAADWKRNAGWETAADHWTAVFASLQDRVAEIPPQLFPESAFVLVKTPEGV